MVNYSKWDALDLSDDEQPAPSGVSKTPAAPPCRKGTAERAKAPPAKRRLIVVDVVSDPN